MGKYLRNTKTNKLHPVGFEPTTFFRSRIMSAVQSATLPWMLCILTMIKKRIKNINPFDFFLLLCAFIYGNMFAIQCSTLNWGFLLIFGLVIFLEILDRFVYLSFPKNENTTNDITLKGRKFYYNENKEFLFKIPINGFSLFFLLNTIKRGFLLGIFLEAFKVGS